MLSLPDTVQVFAATQPVDGRCGMDRLSAMVRHSLGHDPLSGQLFVFFSKRLDGAKVLYFARGGYWLLCRRLERGRFCLPWDTTGPLTAHPLEFAQLQLLLEGIDLRDARLRPRWIPWQKT